MRRHLLAWWSGLGLGAVSAAGLAVGQAAPAAEQAALGKEIYLTRCGQCHGPRGEGEKAPALVGPKHNLSGYRTAQELFDYTRKVMPGDEPGRLLEAEYWAVIMYIIRENHLITEDAPKLGRANARQIALDR